MKIGISTSCLYPMHTEDAFEMIASRGIDLTEIFFKVSVLPALKFTTFSC